MPKPINIPAEIKLPSRVDLRRWMSPIENQEDIGSCTANAFAGVLEYCIKRRYDRSVDVSRLFIYYNARMLDRGEGTILDNGATLRNTVEALRKYGVCEEKVWPYEKRLANTKPSDEAYHEAKRYTVVPVDVSTNLKAIKTTLAYGYPIVLGIVLRYSAGDQAKERQGLISIPDPSMTTVQNSELHAIVLCGYNEETKHFIARNSWGTQWGLKGYFHLPYDYLSHSQLFDSKNGVWAIRDILHRSSDLPTMQIVNVVERNRFKQYQKPREKSPHRHRHRH